MRYLSALFLLAAAACDEDMDDNPTGDQPALDDADAGDPDGLPDQDRDAEFVANPTYELWYTCGDPVCQGWTQKNIPNCGPNQKAGDRCKKSAKGKECDPIDQCNRVLVCGDHDPTAGGCPISVRSAKHDIDYLDTARLESVRKELLATKLATWQYNSDGTNGPTHLGFIIDDDPASPAVAADGGHVDLYGYTSMTVATVQLQQQEIDALKAEVEALKTQVAAQKH